MTKLKEQMGRRGVYVLPSLFTTMGLFSGFYSLIASVQGRYEVAAWAILAAAVFDMLDGRVARLLHAESAFGAEYDSLCDMLSFGVAPAVLVYLWALIHLPADLHKLAWLGGFFLVAGAALRLARFNVQLECQDKRYFQGLPTPGMALLIATAVLYHESTGFDPQPWLWLAISLLLSWLMVSNVRFISGKDVDLEKRRSTGLLILMIVVVGLVMIAPYRVPFTVILAYCLHGPMLSLWQNWRLSRYRNLRKMKKAQRLAEKQAAARQSDTGNDPV
ncbi:CDP-diacylglycerol--serine O-phosphatidyltransferase [Mariprofundus erugo]|uniref:CDP-diacylglycerol--serine O-phosphatidyltransferase n=1 Tax=Mariprofundus erugo TaxID=2528639 RepID=A0A5R9GPW8_9PROT|nr:CDP-diacylglycerol--serine O-phosphatidyltransferase [Mariprofundus erugo]TLS66317.1 CDP-diacylglycerol--serine O-phosphatidyltransferase [Mariprofundus erugo]TLS78195.1 CDP-diacylglycerol--serine O-phosphatidyltransferase [Mariprofundus erugo]